MEIANPGRFLTHARERRRLMFLSTCRITRPDGDDTWDPDRGTYTPAARITVYEGPCQIKARSATSAPKAQDVAGAEYGIGTYAICLPWDTPVVDMSATVEITGGDDGWAVAHGPMPVVVPVYGESRTHREVLVQAQDRSAVHDA